MFELLDRISGTYGDKKEPFLREAVPLCGVVNNYRTFIMDIETIYNIGKSETLSRRGRSWEPVITTRKRFVLQGLVGIMRL